MPSESPSQGGLFHYQVQLPAHGTTLTTSGTQRVCDDRGNTSKRLQLNDGGLFLIITDCVWSLTWWVNGSDQHPFFQQSKDFTLVVPVPCESQLILQFQLTRHHRFLAHKAWYRLHFPLKIYKPSLHCLYFSQHLYTIQAPSEHPTEFSILSGFSSPNF